MLSSLGLTLAEYARYSPLLYFPPLFYTPRLLQPDAGAQEQEYPRGAYYDVEFPLTRSSLDVPRKEASPFRSLSSFCASLLKENLYFCVYTQILFLPLNLCS